MATIGAPLSGSNGGMREWEAEADRSFPALDEAVGLLPAEKRAAGFLHIPRAPAARALMSGVFLEAALQVFLPRFTDLARTWNKSDRKNPLLFAFPSGYF